MITDSDLKKFKTPLEDSLNMHLTNLDKKLSFQDFIDLNLTPEKPNSARTVISINYEGTKVGDMYAIVFLPKDGTGDQNTYKLADIIIPSYLRHSEKPEKVIPRAKRGVIAEGFFSFFSVNKNGHIIPYAAHLDELTLNDEKIIVPGFQLGQNKSEYLNSINSNKYTTSPKVQLTTGMDKSGNRFGDPHVIYYGADVDNTIQVVGFLSVTDNANPLSSILSACEIPPRYK